MLYGNSLGGLMVLRQMFRHPEEYSTDVAASPSIWWNARGALADEAGFAKRVGAGDLTVRLLLTSAGDEQYGGDDPTLRVRAEADSLRMIDNVSELASRLTPLKPEKVVVKRVIFPDEMHASASLASLGRAPTFALQP